MSWTKGHFRFSLKAFLLIPLIVLLALVLIGWIFKYHVASGTPGFTIKLQDGFDPRDQFEHWLTNEGYELCQRPKLGSHRLGYRESWYSGKHNDIKHYIVIYSNELILAAEVYHEEEKWIFQAANTKSATPTIDKVAHEIRSWSVKNSSILITPKPED